MGITSRKLAQERVGVNISEYTEMEIEHSNDTSGEISADYQKQSLTSGVMDLVK